MSIERRQVRCDVRRRRGFLTASAALGAALLLPTLARAAQVKVLQGGVKVNGKRATKGTAIRPGDTVETEKGARLAFVVGDDAFLLRGNSKLVLEHTNSAKEALITGLRLLSGGLLAAFAPGARRIETPTATAGIRGTAVYVEAAREQTYFCTCYGVVELRDKAGVERKMVISGYHTPNMIYANPAERGKMQAAEVKDHTDEELIMLERLVGRTSPIVQRNQKLKEAAEPEKVEQAAPQQQPSPEQKPAPEKPMTEQKAAPEQKTAPEQKAAPEPKSAPAEQRPAPKQDLSDEQPLAPPKEMSAPAAEEPPPTSGSKKKQKPGKGKGKPKAEPKPEPEKAAPPPAEKVAEPPPPELGPAPMPPPPPQPPAQEWRLPPPRLDQ
jgi:hypothetical protein